MIVYNRTREKELFSRVRVADTPAARAQGLLGRSELAQDEGLWIVPCPMIHTFFMKFPIDVAFLDRQNKVRRVTHAIKPWRLSPWVFSAHGVLETAAGTLAGRVEVGDILEFRESAV